MIVDDSNCTTERPEVMQSCNRYRIYTEFNNIHDVNFYQLNESLEMNGYEMFSSYGRMIILIFSYFTKIIKFSRARIFWDHNQTIFVLQFKVKF